MRALSVMCVCLFLVTAARAEEYQGRVVKVENGVLTLAVTWQGDLKKGKKIDPPVKTEFTLDPKVKILNFRVEEVKDEETRKRILRVNEYVIVKTEKKDQKEIAISVQTLPGAGPGG